MASNFCFLLYIISRMNVSFTSQDFRTIRTVVHWSTGNQRRVQTPQLGSKEFAVWYFKHTNDVLASRKLNISQNLDLYFLSEAQPLPQNAAFRHYGAPLQIKCTILALLVPMAPSFGTGRYGPSRHPARLSSLATLDIYFCSFMKHQVDWSFQPSLMPLQQRLTQAIRSFSQKTLHAVR